MSKKITEIRLKKEEQSIIKQPVSQAIIIRSDVLVFQFCLYGLEEPFTDGFYHGMLQLPDDYPFSPPKIKFLTPNGRFQVNKTICTTFTHYHKETWSSSWNIRTIVTALISFMYAHQPGIGGIFDPPTRRAFLAKKSLGQNFKNKEFVDLFADKLYQLNLVSAQKKKQLQQILQKETRRSVSDTYINQNLTQYQLPFQLILFDNYIKTDQRTDEENNPRKRMIQRDDDNEEDYEPEFKRIKTEREVVKQNEVEEKM